MLFVQQKKYREEAEKTMSHYVPVLDTPEMQRVRENQKNFSTVSNKCKKVHFVLLGQRVLQWEVRGSSSVLVALCLSPCPL